MKNLVVFLGLMFIVVGCRTAEQPSTWSVVAVDPATGEVGIAAASCVAVPIDVLAALVPGKGVAATQAAISIENRNRVFDALMAGASADEIIDAVTAADTEAATRQYGIITLSDGQATVAGYTGADNNNWAGNKQRDTPFPVTVQGNILESEEVVNAALDAFSDETLGSVTLSDRLMRAMEAGSAAGGDKRCNESVQQTAAAAFIMVAQGNDVPFAVANVGESNTDAVDAPTLYLSVSEPVGGANPLIALREQYDAWRKDNLPPCPDCNLSAIPVPPGDDATTARFPLWLSIGIGLLIALAAAFIWQRAKKK